MTSERKLIGYSLLIGILVAAPLFLGLFMLGNYYLIPASSSNSNLVLPTFITTIIPTESVISLETPTFTPTPTSIGTANTSSGSSGVPTPTDDSVLTALNAGKLVFSGPLSYAQQLALYKASLTYAQDSVNMSKRVAKEINGVGYGDPSNICGPLSIAILRDAGVISPDIVPHDFWLLDPLATLDQLKLASAFPEDRFSHAKITTPLNKMNWLETPLFPGDFLFIWHGSWGNFDHMMVVNRVDSDSRAFSVTNFGTADGFLIAETLLYDPSDPLAGIFHTWTRERDAILGSTGFGGYEVWRTKIPGS